MDGDGRWSEGDLTAHFGQEGDIPVVGDFNGDGNEEIGIFRAGQWIIDSNGNRQIDEVDLTFELGGEGDKPVVGDFDGEGRAKPGVYRGQEPRSMDAEG
jgi:serine-aspartate repeat-containing protein C/D/E